MTSLPPALLSASDPALAHRVLDVIEHDVVPLTARGVARGDKVFGAALLRKDDLSLVLAETNHETANPLFHGEVHTLVRFYSLPSSDRPATSELLFVSTHEPCSLCLSAITWSGFDAIVYLFTHEDSRDSFAIPHDLRILQEVFGTVDYRRDNAFFTARSVAELGVDDARVAERISGLSSRYAELSATYQTSRGGSGIPLP
ncbi:nucleoside deaminase [Nocardioides sp.]|uniref:nucleoside deaminase n=1 Tax=Nocardioides sp. TaxID=35761 RepID=UPI003515437A